jgi:hypothetical protein
MKAEYKEGEKARENFEDAMKAIFKGPKKTKSELSDDKSSTKQKTKGRASRKSEHGKGG